MHGVSILLSRVSEATIERYALCGRIVSRGGECKELHFHYREPKPMLPVIIGGKLVICEWGNWSSRSKLPRAAWIGNESIEAGKWRWLEPESVEIQADFGLDKGVWYQITQGVRGVIVRDEQEKPHAYILTVPASHYYRIMTRCSRMPVLIEQDI
jgi:hypothetical protein